MAASKGKRVLLAIVGLLAIVVLYAGWRLGPVLWDAWQAGLFTKTEKRDYSGTSADNLKAIHTALMMYHESEGQFPEASGWMDAIWPRLQAGDMKRDEALKKLVHPSFWPPQDRSYGYAMNEMASGKYRDDVPDPGNTPLVFDSSNTARNAHGTPEDLLPSPPRAGGNLGISVEGQILKL